MAADLQLNRIIELPADFDRLVLLSLREQFAAIQRMRTEFASGANRFDRAGETLFEARIESRLIGICGLNRDPYTESPDIGRVRHLYVDPDYRRRGVGRALVATIIAHARSSFSRLRLRTLRSDADQFYLAIGFCRVSEANVTHEMSLS